VDDVLLAIDGARVAQDTLQDRLDRTDGQPAKFAFWRGQSLRELSITPVVRRLEEWKLAPVEGPTEAQRAAFEAWTGHELPAGSGEMSSPQAPSSR
jgi:predicted metalloprotease with PDZ domain